MRGMAKPSAHPDFQRLDAEWRQKLKDVGFDDAEEVLGKNPDNRRLKNTCSGTRQGGTAHRYKALQEDQRLAKARYFQIIGERIQETVFDSPQERQILTLYFEGFTQQQIKAGLDTPACRATICNKLYKWLRRWGLK